MAALPPAPDASDTLRSTRHAIASLMEARRLITLRMALPRLNPPAMHLVPRASVGQGLGLIPDAIPTLACRPRGRLIGELVSPGLRRPPGVGHVSDAPQPDSDADRGRRRPAVVTRVASLKRHPAAGAAA